MAAVTAKATGNWSDTGTWTSGSLPGIGDNVDSNGYTVTIDQDVTVASLVNTNASTGGFTCSSARTIAANITATVRTVLTCSHTSGTVSLSGSMAGGSSASARALSISGTGGTTNISTSGMTGGSASGAYALFITANCTINISGDLTGGSSACGMQNNSTGTTTITGNVTGGSGAFGSGAMNNSTGTISVSATATGGSNATAYGLHNVSTGTASCNTAVGGSVAGAAGLRADNSGGTSTFAIAQHSTSTTFPVSGFVKMAFTQSESYLRVVKSANNSNLDLSSDYPAATDVKLNTVYKLGGLTGSLAGGGGSRPYQVFGLEELH